jgi:hypothetical protein
LLVSVLIGGGPSATPSEDDEFERTNRTRRGFEPRVILLDQSISSLLMSDIKASRENTETYKQPKTTTSHRA